jgi:AraC-like DNA-binding protein
MAGCGTATFTDPDDFRKNVPGASLELVLTDHGDFRARVTWIDTGRLRLVRCEENVPRVAFVGFAAELAFISLPLKNDPPPIWSGVKMGPGEIVLHGRGDRAHQRTRGPGCWSFISMAPKVLAKACETFTHERLALPSATKILRPPSKPLAALSRLHARACRLGETKPDLMAHREVTRALEQDLIHALVNCLMREEADPQAGPRQRRAKIMARFEDVLTSHCHEKLLGPALATAVGVPERALHRCCARFLQMSPGQYERLRRLNLVRAALRRADPETASVTEVAKLHGFSELGRFAVAYRLLFGEAPSITLHGVPSKNSKLTEFA